MRKRILLSVVALAVIATLTVLPPAVSEADVGVCDPQQSLLCMGLIEHWKLEEASDYTRRGSLNNSPLYEYDWANVGQTSTHKVGSYAASFSNQYGLYVPRYGDLPAYGTIAMWVYQTTQSGNHMLWDTRKWEEIYSGAGAYNASGTLFYLDAGKPTFVAYEDETGGGTQYARATAISANNWHLLVLKVSPYGPYGKAQVCISVDGDDFTCGDLTYNRRSGPADLEIGHGFTGYIDSLSLWGRALSQNEVTMLYYSAAGTAAAGRDFPFY